MKYSKKKFMLVSMALSFIMAFASIESVHTIFANGQVEEMAIQTNETSGKSGLQQTDLKRSESKSEVAVLSSVEAQSESTVIDNAKDLKTAIESATADITLNLASDRITFNMDDGNPGIKSLANITVTLIGVGSGSANSTEIFMTSDVPEGTRFIRLENGKLKMSNIDVTSETEGINGGVVGGWITATNCNFNNNHTTDGVSGGGAIRFIQGDAVIESCTFIKNSSSWAGDGGAVSGRNGGGLIINNSIFDSNSRNTGGNNQYGGAVSMKQPKGGVISITNSAFINNVNDTGGTMSRGGAIDLFTDHKTESILVDNVLFQGNSCPQNNGGALSIMTSSNAVVSNCTFIGNTAYRHGGGLYFENSNDNSVINCTFLDNKKVTFLGLGSGIAAYSSSVALDSCTIIGQTLGTPGTASTYTIKDSLIADSTISSNANIQYLGGNIPVAKPTSNTLKIAKETVLEGYTADTLEPVAPYNLTAPIIASGPAYEAASATSSDSENADLTPRALPFGQNGVERKSPKSDAGAYEAPEVIVPVTEYTVKFDTVGGLPAVADMKVESGELIEEPTDILKEGYHIIGWYEDPAYAEDSRWNFVEDEVSKDITLYAKWHKNPTASPITIKSNVYVIERENDEKIAKVKLDSKITGKFEAVTDDEDAIKTYEIGTQPKKGTVTVDNNGNYVYTLNNSENMATFNEAESNRITDTFDYYFTYSDGGKSNAGLVTVVFDIIAPTAVSGTTPTVGLINSKVNSETAKISGVLKSEKNSISNSDIKEYKIILPENAAYDIEVNDKGEFTFIPKSLPTAIGVTTYTFDFYVVDADDAISKKATQTVSYNLTKETTDKNEGGGKPGIKPETKPETETKPGVESETKPKIEAIIKDKPVTIVQTDENEYTVFDENETPLGTIITEPGEDIEDVDIEKEMVPFGQTDKGNPKTSDTVSIEYQILALLAVTWLLLGTIAFAFKRRRRIEN